MTNTLPALSPTFDDENPFPPIPAIINDDIRTKVFTHRSFHGRLNHGIFEDRSDDPSPDNEKYKLLGDTVLGMVVTDLLLDMYPNLRVGSYTKIRTLIVGSSTLAAISCRYTLPAKLKLHPAQEMSLRASPDIQAHVFQSYIGGLHLDQGLTAVEKWLKALFKPYTTEAYVHARAQHNLLPSSVSPSTVSPDPASSSSGTDTTPLTHQYSSNSSTGHLVFFNEKLQKEKREKKFYYDCITEGRTTPTWVSRIEVDGKVLGRGKGDTKKAARNEAAKEALIGMGTIV